MSEISRGWESWEEAGSQELASEEIPENIFEIMRNGTLSQVNTALTRIQRQSIQVEGFIEHYGVDYSLDQRDEYGHSPAHWMALNGHTHVCRSFPLAPLMTHEDFPFRYLMTKKVAKIDLHSNNGQGPRPIHWASR